MASPEIHYEVLPNGLTLLFRESHVVPVANLQIWAQVGSADERPGEEGLAHFHEHMLFKGTERRGVGDVAGEVEGAGGRINAYTTFDVTVYYATLPSKSLDVGVDVLIDAVRNSRFDAVEVQREVEVVLEEIRRSDDNPGHVLGDLTFRTTFQAHPYRSPILGPAENVERFDKAKVEHFFRRWYTPENLVVVATGDFEAAKLAESVKRAFADAEPGAAARSRVSEPAQHALRTAVLRRSFERARLDISWRAPSFREADATPLDLLAFILGECESSRLVREVKEARGIVDRVDASCYTPFDPGLFTVDIECDPASAREAVEAIVEQIERLRREPVDDEELDRARANFLASEHFERESVSGMASKLGHFHVLGGDFRSEERYFEAVRNASPDDLLRVARQYLAPEKLTACALLPEGATDGLDDAALAAAVEAGATRTRNTFAAPRRVPARPDAAGAVETFELPGGASVHVLPSHDVPVVALRAAFLGGLIAQDEASAGISSFTSAMWMRGTRTRSAASYARAVENLAAEIDGFSGRNSMGFTLEATSDKLDPALGLFAEALLQPGFDPAEIERERRETLAAIERRADRLAERAFLLFQRTLFERHPYRIAMLGERESVSNFDVETVAAHHDRLVRAENLSIGVAGDVDPERIAQTLSVRLAPLASGGFDEPVRPLDPAPTEPRFAEEQADRAQAHLVVGFRGVTVDDPDRFALELLTQVLTGQSGRLFLELRDRQSLAYSVSAMNVEGVDPGFFSIYIATAPEKLEQARAGIARELDRLVQETISYDELDRARRYLTGNHAIDRQRSAARAAHLALDARYGVGVEAAFRYPEDIEALTREDVLRAAQRILRFDERVEALIRP